jgi:hypothetical protein
VPTATPRTLRIAAASVGLVALSAVTVVNLASSALFTDTQTAGAATVTTGNVALSLSGKTLANLGTTALAPGDVKFAVVTVSNSGSLADRYAATLTWSASNAMTQAVQVSVRALGSAPSTCDATLAWGASVDNTTYLAKDVVAAGTSQALFGSTAAGAQLGDRSLAASSADYLCVRTVLPAATGNTAASQSSALSIAFDAEQTANNA